jgi:hypothetical protein
MGGDHLWEAIGAIGQAVSAFALLSVVTQIGLARAEMRRAARMDRLEATRDMFLAQATHPELALTLERWRSATGSSYSFVKHAVSLGFTEGESRTLWAYACATWQNTQGSIESVDLFSSGLREDLQADLRALYGGNGVQAKWYELSKSNLNPNAARYIDNLLAQPS